MDPHDKDMLAYQRQLRRELPKKATKTRFAVRPNLNRKGVLTYHAVGPRGGVNYGRAEQHSAPWCGFTMHNAVFHESPAKTGRARYHKVPCASVIGNCTWGYQYDEQLHEHFPVGFWREGRYTPADGFTLPDRGRATWNLTEAEFVWIQGTKFWVRNPTLEPPMRRDTRVYGAQEALRRQHRRIERARDQAQSTGGTQRPSEYELGYRDAEERRSSRTQYAGGPGGF